jgi:hypothetical protein
MSADSLVTGVNKSGSARQAWTERDVDILRYAGGATFAVAVALGLAWPLSYIVPVLLLSVLAAPDKGLSFKSGVSLILIVVVATFLAVEIGTTLIPYTAVYIPFIGILLFRIFYAGQRGAPPVLILLLLIAITVIPLVRLIQPSVAVFVARGLVVDFVVTVLLAWLIFGVVPPRPRKGGAVEQASPRARASEQEAFRSAAMSTVVVLPLLLSFYLFELTGAIVLLVFTCLLASNPTAFANPTVGKVFIIANVLGGLISILFYEILVIVPVFPMLVFGTLLIGLLLGQQVFSGKPTGKLFATAFSTTLLVIGSATTSEGEAGSLVYTRVAQITLAVFYVVGFFTLLNRILPRKDA